MEKEWHYLENQFQNCINQSYKRAYIISNYHDAALKAAKDHEPDPDFITLYDRYHPLHSNLVNEYTSWKDMGGQQSGSTLNLNQLLSLMVGKLDNWAPRILIVHAKNTEAYKKFFPQGRKPFTRGATDTRIQAVKTLAKGLENDIPLNDVKTEVDTYYGQLDGARDNQEGNKTGAKFFSVNLDNAIKAAMLMQFRNMGLFINKWADNPALIAPFFDEQTIREKSQTTFTGTLTPSENEAILEHTFLPDDELRLKITGIANAKFYLATTPNGTNSTPVEITGNHEQTIKASDFGANLTRENRYLTAINQSNTETIKYLVELY